MCAAVSERYERDEFIASGGMADVYRGRDRMLDRQIAIRRLRGAIGDPATRERFEREARLLAGFTHPNAVAVYDAVEDELGPLIVMEFVEGLTLRDHLGAAGRLPVEEATAIADQLLSVLADGMRHALRAGARGEVTVADSTVALPVVVDPLGRVDLADAPQAMHQRGVLAVGLFVVLGALIALGVWAVGERNTPRTAIPDPTTVPTLPTTITPQISTPPPPGAPAPVVVPGGRAEKAPKPGKAEEAPGQAKK